MLTHGHDGRGHHGHGHARLQLADERPQLEGLLLHVLLARHLLPLVRVVRIELPHRPAHFAGQKVQAAVAVGFLIVPVQVHRATVLARCVMAILLNLVIIVVLVILECEHCRAVNSVIVIFLKLSLAVNVVVVGLLPLVSKPSDAFALVLPLPRARHRLFAEDAKPCHVDAR